ncbi:hypothetical protein FJ973_29615 [Mesorhizobium sp. B2-1-3]|uniref:hypothetical protein n=1 Tax=Mesorhizobium sp. B2-1-3 TaxID=2589972 RepID=UPI00112C4644|nr:hypothetical protein [Mesorhizobium sp. B2-1-3]TPN03803.1 hypothetical protein FJ973_29615 [Mesorhizobium sp. B2-1-3]
MAGSIYDWSQTPDDNQTADADINWLENQLPSTVNGSARVMMERVAELIADLGGALVPTGTANALTITANSAFTAYQQGLRIAFKAASTNTGAVTANVNSLGSKAIRKQGASADVALVAGDIVAGGIFLLHYSTAANSAAGAWILINPSLIASLAAVAFSGSASDLTTGTLPDGRFPATLPAASGANLTALNVSNASSGTLADARLPTTMAGKTLTSAALNGTLGATTPAAISGTTGSFSSTLGATGAVTFSSTLGVTGAATFGSSVTASGNILAAEYLFTTDTDTGMGTFAGNSVSLIAGNSIKATFAASGNSIFGNTTINGTLTVTG